jgi:hypothetical protein
MSLRPVEIVFAALFAVTVAGKLLALHPQDEGDRTLFAATASRMLAEQGYATHLNRRPFGIAVEARRGDCRMQVREYPPEGTIAATIADQARSIGPLRFAYRGSLVERPPKLGPLAEIYMRRLQQRLGLSPPRQPIVAVAAAPGCDVAALPWQRLATLAR